MRERKVIVEFTVQLQKRGLSFPTVGLTAVELLEEIAEKPFPADRKSVSLGPLIRHGLVQFDRENNQFPATEKGRAYLTKLKKAKLLPA